MFFVNDRILGNIFCTKIQNNICGLQMNACRNLKGELPTPKKGENFISLFINKEPTNVFN
jgi:hypothetical protein